MNYCKTCKLSYQSPIHHCLFCNNELSNQPPTEYSLTRPLEKPLEFHYPAVQKRRKTALILKKLLTFLLLVAIISCFFLDISDDITISWSLYPIASCLYVLYLIQIYTKRQKNIKKITYSAYASIVYLLMLGLFTKPFWAIEFIFPLGILTTNLCLTFYFLTRKRRRLHDVAVYIVIASLLGLLPILLYFFDCLSYTWPSIACSLYSLVILFGLMFFSTQQTKEEIKRRFHF